MKKSINRVLSIFLVLIMALSMAPVVTIAAQSDKVTIRIEGTGSTILMEPTLVTVADGATAEDALRAALIARGHDPSDSSDLSMPGGFINTILGTSSDTINYTTYWMYALNNEIASLGVGQQKVTNGDELVFYFVESYLNSYAYFDKSEINVKTNTDFSFKLKTYSYDASYNPVVSPCEGATLVIDGIESVYTTDASGDVTLSFSAAGTYIVSAKKGATNTLDAAYCKVVVTDADPATVNHLDGLVVSSGINNLTLSPEFIAHTLNYRLSVPYETYSINITPIAALGAITINSDPVASGNSQSVNLLVGSNIIQITLDSAVTYKLIVSRRAKVLAQDKKTQIDNILQSCSQSFVNTTDYWKILGMARYNKGATVNTSAAVAAAVSEAQKPAPSSIPLGMWVATLMRWDMTVLQLTIQAEGQ